MGVCENRNDSSLVSEEGGSRLPFYCLISYFVLLWVDLFFLLEREWHFNEQYSFAYLVPLFGILLFRKRLYQTPNLCFAIGNSVYISLLPLLFLFVLHIAERAHPEWRLLFWAHAAVVFFSSCLFLLLSGGKKNFFIFFFPFFFLLTCLPWPYFIENKLKGDLVQSITWILVEFLNALGIIAENVGNLIHIENGVIGIDEACSGVQSLQAGIMLTLFLGAYLNMGILRRCSLFFIGLIFTFIFNIIRTFSLAFMTYKGGPELAMDWHDFTGMCASLGVFVSITLIAFKLEQKLELEKSFNFVLKLKLKVTIFFLATLCLLAGSRLFSFYYYSEDGRAGKKWKVDLVEEKLPHVAEKKEVSKTVQAQLRFDRGAEYRWSLNEDKISCQYLYFAWESMQISTFAGIHNPSICLPAGGFTLEEKEEDLKVDFSENSLDLEVYRFVFSRTPVYVFYAVWDESLGVIEFDRNFKDRIQSIKNKELPTKRFSIEFILTGVVSSRDARRYAEKLLKNTLSVSSL